MPYAHYGNPQSLNLYGYVENNPTTFGDPDGHCPQCPEVGAPVIFTPETLENVGKGLANAAVDTFNYVSSFASKIMMDSEAPQLPEPFPSDSLTTKTVQAVAPLLIPGDEIEGAATAIGEVTGESISATTEAATGTRYVGAGEASVIEKTGMVPNTDAAGNAKNVFYTPEPPVSSAAEAQSKYQLGSTPTHAAELNTKGIHNTYGGNVENGKGIEMITRDKIPVKRLKSLNSK